MSPIYFDYNATTPLDAGVRDAMLPYLERVYGNPSSVHRVGREARAALDDARDRVAQVFRSKPSEVVFTSGGTESNNLAVFGVARLLRSKGRHLVTSQVEHHAVLHAFGYLEKHEGFEVTYLPVDATGRVDPETVRRAIRPDTVLVSVMAANNEIGTVQPVAEIGSLCRELGVLFHCDAVQAFGKLPFANIDQFNADLVSVCAHKFHGPKGAGALFIRSPLQPHPILFGGGHETERRAGTENLPAIIGLTEALERFVREPVFPAHTLAEFSEKLASAASSIEGVTLLNPLSPRGTNGERDGERGNLEKEPPLPDPLLRLRPEERESKAHGFSLAEQGFSKPLSSLPNTVAFTVDGSDSIALMAALDIEGVCASSGSACSAGSLEPSHVVLAVGQPPNRANALVRFSLGRETTEEEVDAVCELLPAVLRQVRCR